MAQSETPTQASAVVSELKEGHVIEVPQYERPLTVTSTSPLNGESNAYIGIGFVENPTGTPKTLVVNQHSGRVYLTAGTTDKGEVTNIEIVSTAGDETRSDEEAAAVAAELDARDDVRRATAEWDGCDVAFVVEDGTGPADLTEKFESAGVNSFDAAPYTLIEGILP